MGEPDEIKLTLKRIAVIAHSGGLDGLYEFDALYAVRRLTLKYWDSQQTEDEQRRAVIDAMRASDFQ